MGQGSGIPITPSKRAPSPVSAEQMHLFEITANAKPKVDDKWVDASFISTQNQGKQDHIAANILKYRRASRDKI